MRMAKASQEDGLPPSKGAARAALRPVVDVIRRADISAEAWAYTERVRQSYLDALPIATAIVCCVEGEFELRNANSRFVALDASRPASQPLPVLECPAVAKQLHAFFDRNDNENLRFEWRDGDAVSGRHFQVNIAPMVPIEGEPPRCLLTLVDRTVEIENARSLRAELLHDSLTGLPNRSAFAEAVDEVMASAARATMPCCWSICRASAAINESLGGVAGDEVIITVARRLISTLRAGDLLARIGGDEFGILLRLAHGTDDAAAAARRIQSVLSAPVPPCPVRGRHRMRDRLRDGRRGADQRRGTGPQRPVRAQARQVDRPRRGAPSGRGGVRALQARSRDRAAPRDRSGRPAPRLPADHRSRHRPRHRLRGAVALDASRCAGRSIRASSSRSPRNRG